MTLMKTHHQPHAWDDFHRNNNKQFPSLCLVYTILYHRVYPIHLLVNAGNGDLASPNCNKLVFFTNFIIGDFVYIYLHKLNVMITT